MKYEVWQVEPMALFGMSLLKLVLGEKLSHLGCFGFEVTTFVFAGVLVVFTVNVVIEIRDALGIKVLTV